MSEEVTSYSSTSKMSRAIFHLVIRKETTMSEWSSGFRLARREHPHVSAPHALHRTGQGWALASGFVFSPPWIMSLMVCHMWNPLGILSRGQDLLEAPSWQ